MTSTSHGRHESPLLTACLQPRWLFPRRQRWYTRARLKNEASKVRSTIRTLVGVRSGVTESKCGAMTAQASFLGEWVKSSTQEWVRQAFRRRFCSPSALACAGPLHARSWYSMLHKIAARRRMRHPKLGNCQPFISRIASHQHSEACTEEGPEIGKVETQIWARATSAIDTTASAGRAMIICRRNVTA